MTRLPALLLIALSCFVTPALATSALTTDERPVSQMMPEGSYREAARCHSTYFTRTTCTGGRLLECRYARFPDCSVRGPMGCRNTQVPCGGVGTRPPLPQCTISGICCPAGQGWDGQRCVRQ